MWIKLCYPKINKKKGASNQMDEKKRIRRPAEERAQEVDEKIEKLQQALIDLDDKRMEAMAEFDKKEASIKNKIAMLAEKKENILSPKPIKRTRRSKKQKIADILKQATKSGLKPEEIAEMLGVEIDAWNQIPAGMKKI